MRLAILGLDERPKAHFRGMTWGTGLGEGQPYTLSSKGAMLLLPESDSVQQDLEDLADIRAEVLKVKSHEHKIAAELPTRNECSDSSLRSASCCVPMSTHMS